MTEPLRAAIEQLYRVFARYPLNPDMDGSPLHADLAKWNAQLAAEPLRELTEDDLVVFYFKVLTTWGEEKDFKHFLPRILELLTTFPMGWEEWVALDKLNYGHWRTWPQREQRAVTDYLLALWDWLLTTDDERADAFCSDYFEAIANVYPEPLELLRRWEQAPVQAQIRLGCFVFDTFEHLRKKRQLSAFDTRPEVATALLTWLPTDAVLGRLEQAFFAATDEYLAMQVSQAVQLLENYRRQVAR